MKLSLYIIIFFIGLVSSFAQALDGKQNEVINLSPNLSFLEDPFAVENLPQPNLLKIRINLQVDPFAQNRQVNMVAATERKARTLKNQQGNFSFIDRQLASFNKERPKFGISFEGINAPDYHNQPIYSGSNRVDNQAFRESKTIEIPLYNNIYTSPYRRYRNYWNY